MSEIPTAVWSGSFSVFGVDVRCHVLDNGQRIIEADSLAALLEAMADPTRNNLPSDDLAAFARWQQAGMA